MEWVVCKFDEHIISSVDGWQFLSQIVVQSHLQSHPNRRVLLVFPPLEGDEERISNMISDALSTSVGAHISQDDQANRVRITFMKGDCEESVDDIFGSWKSHVMGLYQNLGLALVEHKRLQVYGGVLQGIRDAFQRLHKMLLGISFTGEATPALVASCIACASEISAKIAVQYFNEIALKQFQMNDVIEAKFFDCKQFLNSESTTGVLKSPRSTPSSNISNNNNPFNQLNTGGANVQNYLQACYEFTMVDPTLKLYLEDLKSRLVITEGNVSRDAQGNVAIFGRKGSDLSLASIAAKLQASFVEFWISGMGVFTSHIPSNSPFPSSRVIKQLSYEEAQEIAATNAHVVHPNSIRVLQDHNIGLYVKPYKLHGKCNGTFISKLPTNMQPQIKCVCVRTGIIVISIDSLHMWHQVGFLSNIFAIFKKYNISINLVTTSEANVTLTLDTSDDDMEHKVLFSIISELKALNCKVEQKGPCSAISLVGQNMRSIYSYLDNVNKLFEGYSIYMISQSASNVNLTYVVDQDRASTLTQKIHDALFEDCKESDSIGTTWQQLYNELHREIVVRQEPINHVSGAHTWWRKRREELLALAQQETPVFVYDMTTLEQSARQILDLVHKKKVLDLVFYAMKANNHPEILKLLNKLGFGMECVSIEEVQFVLKLFPDIDRTHILFTPNFIHLKEYEMALSLGIYVTIDNVFVLEQWGPSFTNKDIFLRIDPGHGLGHHSKVKTAGKNAKFGIPLDRLPFVATLCEAHHVRVIGLHAHVGSGILEQPESWKHTAECLLELSQTLFPHVTMIDLGGGLGVPYKPSDKLLDLEIVAKSLSELVRPRPNMKLMMEPGRYLVAQAGIILSRITQIKQKDDHIFVGVDTGMNSLIRPALYSSYHEIVNLTRIDEPVVWKNVDVVGPICETGDVLGVQRCMPVCKHGDVMVICTAGAYGKTMSSHYNMRSYAKEVILTTPPDL